MIAAVVIAVAALMAPTTLDLPPEGIWEAATANLPAQRLDPPSPVESVPVPPSGSTVSAGGRCGEMSSYRAAAGLPPRFDQLGWRESNCRNEEGVHTGCCWGWWQLNVGLHLRDHRLAGRYHDCGVWSRTDVDSDTPQDKARQACAAKALFDVVGYSAWSTT